MGVCLLKFLNRSTAYNSYPTELKLDRIILDISLHNPHEKDV